MKAIGRIRKFFKKKQDVADDFTLGPALEKFLKTYGGRIEIKWDRPEGCPITLEQKENPCFGYYGGVMGMKVSGDLVLASILPPEEIKEDLQKSLKAEVKDQLRESAERLIEKISQKVIEKMELNKIELKK